MAVRPVLAAGFALLLLAVGVALAQSAPRQAGSNYVPEVAEVVKLRGDGRHCQQGQTVPEGAAALRLLVGTYGSPAPAIRVTARTRSGEPVTGGRRPMGGREGRLEIPVRLVEETTPETVVCIQLTTVGRTVLYGEGAQVRLDWLREGDESWFSLIPTIAHRMALARGNPFGPLLLVVAASVLIAALILTARLLLRELAE